MLLFLGDGIMSEPEDASNPADGTTTIWRDSTLVNLLHNLDEAYVQLGSTSRAKRERCKKIDRLKAKKPQDVTIGEDGYGDIPPKLPTNWILQDAKAKLSEVERHGLDFRAAVDLGPAQTHLAIMVHRPS